jgi:hypothetical protein
MSFTRITPLVRRVFGCNHAALTAALTLTLAAVEAAPASEAKPFLENIHRHMTLASTVAENGDLNPYAVVFAAA